MRKRFLLEGEQQGFAIWIAVAFKEAEVSVGLSLFKKEDVEKTILQEWVKGKQELPKAYQSLERTIEDENLLPEDVKVENVGRVRDIEIEWADNLMQTRMMQGFASELLLLKDRVAALEDYQQEMFDECSNFWERLLVFKKEHVSLSNEVLDTYKFDLDILFEALKALRQDFKKERSDKAREAKVALVKDLEAAEAMFAAKKDVKHILGQLKKIRSGLNTSGLRKNHYEDIDTRINELFAKLGESKAKVDNTKTNKRISDLEEISAKMQKSLDWDLRELDKEKKNRERSEQIFQVKLLDAKIEMLSKKAAEKKEKLDDILGTLTSLKKKL